MKEDARETSISPGFLAKDEYRIKEKGTMRGGEKDDPFLIQGLGFVGTESEELARRGHRDDWKDRRTMAMAIP